MQGVNGVQMCSRFSSLVPSKNVRSQNFREWTTVKEPQSNVILQIIPRSYVLFLWSISIAKVGYWRLCNYVCIYNVIYIYIYWLCTYIVSLSSVLHRYHRQVFPSSNHQRPRVLVRSPLGPSRSRRTSPCRTRMGWQPTMRCAERVRNGSWRFERGVRKKHGVFHWWTARYVEPPCLLGDQPQ